MNRILIVAAGVSRFMLLKPSQSRLMSAATIIEK
jgi:hypothetical protein